LALPVASVEAALPFYEGVMGFRLVERIEAPQKAAILERDSVRIGLAENGGDPTQDGCFFVVAPDGLCYCLGQREGTRHDGR